MLSQSRFLKACRREPVDATPVWFMRQAGRYMPEYREIRAKMSMLDAIRNPEVSQQITLQPINAFQLDAAIIFADILTPLIGMGIKLDFIKGEGPQIENPIRATRDVDMLGVQSAAEALPFALEAIRLTVAELTPRNIPLIGFCRAPFTLASYAIEGGGSKNYERTKGMMYAEPAAWKRLMDKMVTVLSDLLARQVEAGASALQIFDSWAGALSPYDFARYVAPYTRQLIENAKKSGVPVIYFSTGTGPMLDQIAALGSDVVSVDWRVRLDSAWQTIGSDRAIQGNLDPVLLFAPWREVQAQTDEILAQAAGRPGHIFNLGHGILPGTPLDTVRRLAEYVHEKDRPVGAGGFMSIETGAPPIGVLLMAYGGPASLDELPGYLADIRSGRPTTEVVLREMTNNYRQIGGKSPLLEISGQQGAALEKLLNGDALRPQYKVYLGMRHWDPWIEDTIRVMMEDGIRQAVGIVLAPHYSSFSVAKYQQKVQAGLAMYGGTIEFAFVDSYNTAPKYIEALANRVREGIARFPQDEQAQVHTILSAHSLPVRIIKMGDPYKEQLLETAGLVAAAAGLNADQWTWSFQSAGRSPEPWLEPTLEATIQGLVDRGVRNMVSVPIGFVSDHVEILYDIDIKAQALAKELGVHLERPPALNLDPLFIETLADLVHAHSGKWQLSN